MLEEYGVVDVQPDYFVRADRATKKSKCTLTTEPTLLKCKNNKAPDELRYIAAQVAMWDPVGKDYLNTGYHKMVYTWHYGEIPVGYVVDHINTNPLDNRVENLRLITE